MRHKILALTFFGMSIVLTVVAVLMAVKTLGGGGDTAQQPQGQPVAGDISYAAPDASGGQQGVDQPLPTDMALPTVTPEPTEEPWGGPVVQEQPAAVGSEYFADAGFLGNSVLSGLWLYNNDALLPTDETHWFWANSLTILGASPYAAQMAAYDFGKIYIGFGINEVNYNKDTLRSAFNTVIDQLQADHPDAIIYLMSVTPVSKWCDSNRDFKQSAVISFNTMLQEIATEQHVWYLDVYPVLCGEDGFLPSDVTSDGIHFNPAHYQKWFDYMTTHYVPDGTSPTVTTDEEIPVEEGD